MNTNTLTYSCIFIIDTPCTFCFLTGLLEFYEVLCPINILDRAVVWFIFEC